MFIEKRNWTQDHRANLGSGWMCTCEGHAEGRVAPGGAASGRLARRVALAAALLATGAALLPGAGCGGRPDVLEQELKVTGPIVLGHWLAYLDQTRERVTLVRPFERTVRHVAVGRRPAFMQPTPDGAHLLVICKGWRAQTRDEEDEPPSLYVIDPGSEQPPATYRLGSPFDEVSLSPDSRYAVAYFSASADPGPDELFRNPNAVSILDLAPDGGDATPVEKTVRSFGDVPLGVLFSPPDMAPVHPDGSLGTPRTLAVVFAEGYLTFLDVTHPERSEVTVHLTRPEDTTVVTPRQLVFAPEAGTAFLRSAGSNDIYAFTLSHRAPQSSRQNDFIVSINTLAAGTTPADVGVFVQEGERKILVANQGSQDLTVIDAYTSQFVNIPVGDPVDRVLLWPPENPETAVVFSQGAWRNRIHFLGLDNVEERGGQNLSVLQTNEPIQNIEIIPGRDQALVLHDDSRSVMSVLDLTERTLSPLTSRGALAGYAFTASGGQLVGFAYGEDLLGVINLENLAVRPLPLSYLPKKVLALYPAGGKPPGEETQTVVVDHQSPGGRISVVPNPGVADRTQTYVLSGFLLGGLLEQAR
jgi:hypothetical protein